MYKFLLASSCEVVAFFIGMIMYRKLNKAYKLIYLQVFISFLIECGGFAFEKVHPRHSNAWLYNLYLPIDCGMLLWAAHYFINEKIKIRPFIFIVGYSVFIAVWLFCIIQSGWNEFAFIAVSVDGFLILIAYLLVLYSSIISNTNKLLTLSIFWTCLGIILYYGCSIPYFSMYQYLAKKLTAAEDRKLYYILLALNYIRYLSVTFSFYLHYKQNKPNKKSLSNASW